MKRIIALLLTGISFYASGQQVLKGRILEPLGKDSLTGAAYATVHWVNTTTSAMADSNGFFQIEKVAGHAQLLIRVLGYANDTVTYKGEQFFTITLKNAFMLKEYTLREKQTGITIDPLSTQKVEIAGEKELRKAACCNLSESFETSTTVDVSFADAVTGVKQIQMLGLEGKYTLLTIENQPRMRGLATNYGLAYVPGPWIESIQLSKGTGSVVNGYESIAGQINVELKKPYNSERIYFNQYVNEMGRAETNLNLAHQFSKKWSTILLLHGDFFDGKNDRNKDGYLDIPLSSQYGLSNTWKYNGTKGLESQIGVKLLSENRTGGQLGFDPVNEKGKAIDYGVLLDTKRYEAFAKTGYVWKDLPFQSIGITISAINHNQQSWFGTRSYEGKEQSFYTNLIFQSIITHTSNRFTTGISFLRDNFLETYDSLTYKRTEIVPGAFFEFTWTPSSRFSLVAGLRYDMHSLFGNFITPRLHTKYAINEKLTLRTTFGRGLRSANIFAENTSVFASSRQLTILGTGGKVYGLQPEIAWDYGINMTQDFKLFHRKGSISADAYRTDFENQVVCDRDFSSDRVLFYNLKNGSYVNSLQLELNYELIKRVGLKTAYKWLDMETNYLNGKKQQPFVSKQRFFINLDYTSKTKWSFDYTLQWYGKKRIPFTPLNSVTSGFSPSYFVMNAQVSKAWKKIDAYIGCENLLGFRQTQLIMDPSNPFGASFDASLVWGPVIGRMTYAGIRYKLK